MNSDNKIEAANKAFLANDFRNSLKIYLDIIETDFANFFVQQRIAECYYAIGDYEKSTSACNATLELNSNLFIPHVILAYIYSRANRIDKSIEEVKIAFTIQPDSDKVLECYGTISLSIGELDNAISLLLQALSKNPSLEAARNNLAIAYKRKGNKKQYFTEMKAAFLGKRSLQNFFKLLTAFNQTYLVILVIVNFAFLLIGYIFKIKVLLIVPLYFIIEGYINLYKLIRARNWTNVIIYFAGNSALLLLVYIILLN